MVSGWSLVRLLLERWRLDSALENSSDRGEPEQLTKGHDRIRHVFYSSDGRWLYFQPNHQNIYRMPALGGPAQQITHFPESGLFIEEPTISPDKRYLVYCRSSGGSSLWLITLSGDGPARQFLWKHHKTLAHTRPTAPIIFRLNAHLFPSQASASGKQHTDDAPVCGRSLPHNAKERYPGLVRVCDSDSGGWK
jgi:hypothetical protein